MILAQDEYPAYRVKEMIELALLKKERGYEVLVEII